VVRVIDIDHYFDQYIAEHGMVPGHVEVYGKTYRQQGHLAQDDLFDLTSHVSSHSARYVTKNDTEACRNATADAAETRHDASKVSVLCGLHGVKVPTASYILTALDPLNNAVVNKRTWASLRYLGYVDGDKTQFTADDYVTALRHIRSIAQEEQCTAAAVGYALAAHGKDVLDRDASSVTPPERIPLKPDTVDASMA
jgi:hypothetical protein